MEWDVWLADLHCAAVVKEGAEEECMTGLHGTPEYCAPEVRCSACNSMCPACNPRLCAPERCSAELATCQLCHADSIAPAVPQPSHSPSPQS